MTGAVQFGHPESDNIQTVCQMSFGEAAARVAPEPVCDAKASRVLIVEEVCDQGPVARAPGRRGESATGGRRDENRGAGSG